MQMESVVLETAIWRKKVISQWVTATKSYRY
jgi:hypothetical protein